MSEKVVLAYSGGLDTTVAVRWLKQTQDLDVIALLVDVGQGGDTELLRKRAMDAGALDAQVIDAREEYANEYVTKALAANALYQDRYPLVSALSRPLICKHLADAAHHYSARYVAHGCTGKGNDQVRFEVSLAALSPDLIVLAPCRGWGMTREEAMGYAMQHNLPISMTPASPYSIDENLWGRAIECGVLEDPFIEPPDDIWDRTSDPAKAPSEPAYLEIEFRRGLPVALDGEALPFSELVARVEKLAGSYGYGRIDMIEDRVVGIKSREVYEAPGALALIEAHTELEHLTLEKAVLRTKRELERTYANLAYEGLWFSPLREALDAFIQSTEQYVNGIVRVKIESGSVRVVGRKSSASLYEMSLATYDRDDAFDHKAAEGFVKLWGLPLKTWARARRADAASRPGEGSWEGVSKK
ncbi:MAG TPA: argininosuccinate synthase [Actinomycetota bacterium]|jgi:argininosuccinate synthase|nr:argininosuccinate synthase [Actinomycetota bacterium]